MANTEVFVVVVEHDALNAVTRERRYGSLGAPGHAQHAAHVREIDDGAAEEIGRRHSERVREALGHDRFAFREGGQHQVAGRNFVVVGIGVLPGCLARTGEVEDLDTAAVDAVQVDLCLARYCRVNDAAQARQVHAHCALGCIEQDLRCVGIGDRVAGITANRDALADRDRVDSEVAATVTVAEYLRIRPDFDDDVVMEMRTAVRRNERGAAHGQEVAVTPDDVADNRVTFVTGHARACKHRVRREPAF